MRREPADTTNHSFSSEEKDPRRCKAEIPQLWLQGGLIAGGSGMVSTAAMRSSRAIKLTKNLRLNASSTGNRALPQGASHSKPAMILHSVKESTELYRNGIDSGFCPIKSSLRISGTAQ